MINFSKTIINTLLAIYLFLPVYGVAQSFVEHMQECKQKLSFNTVPAGSCYGPGTVEIGPGEIEGTVERLGYIKVNDRVDGVVFCRDIDEAGSASFVAMILHNRVNGKTCFLDREFGQTAIDFPSPTTTSGGSYWGVQTNCVGCHATGPYLINRTAEAMAKFGLINNNHDTLMTKYEVISADENAAGVANTILAENVIAPSCGGTCHVLADVPMVDSMVDNLLAQNAMPPGPESVYRWLNRDTPGASGDWETLSGVENSYPHFHCKNPARVDARAVGGEYIFSTETRFPDTLSKFNAKQGLVCKNADQSDGDCNDYEVSFLCDDQWTDWYDNDNPSASGDYESISNFTGLCKSPKGIKARTNVSGNQVVAFGPPDRLFKFSKNDGLICKNDDQPNGEKCNNYTVKFICP